MGTQAGVGMSHHRNPKAAGKEAAEKAMKQAGIEQPDFVFMFASVGYQQQALVDAVRQATTNAPLCGCSGEGIITTGEVDESNFSVAVMVIQSDELKFTHGIATGLKEDSALIGRAIAQEVQQHLQPDTIGMFLLADGLAFNFDRFVSALEQALNLDALLPIFGGTSSDNWEMKQTYQYKDSQVVSDGVAWALLSGKRQVAWAVNHGCIPIGLERKITRCNGNTIYEIDGKPILEVLQEYLIGEEIENWQKAIVNLCLGFKAPGYMQDYDEYLIRFMPSKDDVTGSVTIPTEVTEGTSVWMTRRDHEKISQGVAAIAEQIKRQMGDRPPKLVFQFDCAGRGKVVFRDQQKLELLNNLQQTICPEAPWIGFYTYGEIGPTGGHNCFHNYTAVLMTIY